MKRVREMRIVDLRSDTVTVPTEEMRQAMATAPVGDDVYGEDPTVNKLEAEAAALFQKEAALFVPSGTMGNQLAVMTHCQRGQEVLVDAESHILHYELAAAAILTGVQLCPVVGLHSPAGLEQIDKFVRPGDDHSPATRLLCLENTHNRNGGTVIDADFTARLCGKARSYGLKVHLDGARVWNAAVSLGCPLAALTEDADSVMVCLSKGLAAPVGSLLLGSEDFIRRARRNRKILGGGMRQVGVLAAAGLVALTMRHRLQEDHDNARHLAEEVGAIPGIQMDMRTVQTNMVLMDVAGTGNDASSFVGILAAKGIKTSDFGGSKVRLVTHKDISTADIDYAVQVMRAALS
jgi:threonine aldolase